MLDYLHIRNLALIADMELEFAPGMNVLTGETGAGKSFVVRAIDFLMGERLGIDMIRPDSERAQVEAVFSISGKEVIFRRELLASSGRSRFFINDTVTSQESIRNLRGQLVVHTSQHGQQRLLQPAFQTKVVYSGMQQDDLLQRRDVLLKQYREKNDELRALHDRIRSLSDRRDLLEMHKKLIDKVAPEPGEEERLEALRQQQRTLESAHKYYDLAVGLLDDRDSPGILTQIGELEHALDVLARTDASLQEDLDTVTQCRLSLQDLESRLRHPPLPETDHDPEEVESRLFLLAQLKRKLHRTLPEILSLRDEIEENLSFLDACGLDIRRLEKEESILRQDLLHIVDKVNTARHAASENFTHALEGELKMLGFSEDVRVLVRHEPVELFPECFEDRIRLLWAPNPGQLPQPLERIASGGELSRFLLAVVSLLNRQDEATLIFDEVDSGVGGVTLNRVADRLAALAQRRQMLLITHWPQLAARAQRHFRISKSVEDGKTFTRCKQLDAAERKLELDRMAGVEHA